MKIEPVYLVAPKRVPAMPTRRAFLIAGGTFVLGTSLGGACGYAMGVGVADASGKPSEGAAAGAAAAAAAAAADEELKPSGDVELDELRRLAVKAPIEELIERRMMFVNVAARSYPRDGVVWKGIGRLADAVLTKRDFPDRRLWARYVAQVIDGAQPESRQPLLEKLRALSEVK